jgi:hypothetical protein
MTPTYDIPYIVGFTLGLIFLGVEDEGLPVFQDALLQRGTKGGHGGVCDECKWCGWLEVYQ